MTWCVPCRYCGCIMEYGVQTIGGKKRYAAWCINPECMAGFVDAKEGSK